MKNEKYLMGFLEGNAVLVKYNKTWEIYTGKDLNDFSNDDIEFKFLEHCGDKQLISLPAPVNTLLPLGTVYYALDATSEKLYRSYRWFDGSDDIKRQALGIWSNINDIEEVVGTLMEVTDFKEC
jgi:hypothetical protein